MPLPGVASADALRATRDARCGDVAWSVCLGSPAAHNYHLTSRYRHGYFAMSADLEDSAAPHTALLPNARRNEGGLLHAGASLALHLLRPTRSRGEAGYGNMGNL